MTFRNAKAKESKVGSFTSPGHTDSQQYSATTVGGSISTAVGMFSTVSNVIRQPQGK